jgi:hypothetical protein
MIKKNGKEKQSKQLISLKLIKKNLSTIVLSLLPSYYSVQMQNHFSSRQLFTGLFNAEISSVNSADNTLRNHFDFKDYEGNIQSTADLKGKVVLSTFGHHGVHPVLPNFLP